MELRKTLPLITAGAVVALSAPALAAVYTESFDNPGATGPLGDGGSTTLGASGTNGVDGLLTFTDGDVFGEGGGVEPNEIDSSNSLFFQLFGAGTDGTAVINGTGVNLGAGQYEIGLESIFRISGGGFTGELEVFLNGVSAGIVTNATTSTPGNNLAQTLDVTLGAADAGELELTFTATGTGSGFEQAVIDDLSVTLVPEPGSLALVGLGGLLVLRRRRN